MKNLVTQFSKLAKKSVKLNNVQIYQFSSTLNQYQLQQNGNKQLFHVQKHQFSTQISQKTADKLKKLHKKLEIFSKEGKWYDASKVIEEQISIKEKEKLDTFEEQINLGQLYVELRNLNQAKKLYQEMLKKIEQNQLKLTKETLILQKAQIYSDTASVYYMEREFAQAQNLYIDSINEYMKLGENQQKNSKYEREIGICLLNIGEALKKQEQYFESLKEYEKAVSILQNIVSTQQKLLTPNENDKELVKDVKQKLVYGYEQMASLRGLVGQDKLEDLKTALDLASDAYGEYSPYLLPIIVELAQYFSTSQQANQKSQKNAALKLYNFANEIIEKNGQEAIEFNELYQVYLGQAKLQSEMNLLADAVTTFQRIEKLFPYVEGNLNPTKLMIKGHLGYLFIQQKMLEKAQDELDDALSVYKEVINQQQEEQSNHDFLSVYQDLKNSPESQQYMPIYGVQLCQSAFLKLDLQKQYQLAFEEAQIALELVQGSNKGDCLSVMGQALAKLDRFEEAKMYLKQSVEIIMRERPEEAIALKQKLEEMNKQN